MCRIPRTVSIIDDDDSVRRALSRLIRSAGLPVETFASAEEFLQAAGRAAPRCLILDVRLPGLSGLELYERLSAEGKSAPVVFISAYADDPMRELAQRAGALAFLEKPFEDRQLLEAVARAPCC
jgi:FixJ family two-component response regulator